MKKAIEKIENYDNATKSNRNVNQSYLKKIVKFCRMVTKGSDWYEV